MRALTVSGWDLSVGDDGEPRARDIDLGEKLGLERPRKLRALVEQASAAAPQRSLAEPVDRVLALRQRRSAFDP